MKKIPNLKTDWKSFDLKRGDLMNENDIKKLVEDLKSQELEENDLLLNILHALHKKYGNYIPKDVMMLISEELDLPTSRLYEVMTFYTMFSTKPRGKHIIRVCESLPCHVTGGKEIVETLKRILKIDFGETTDDGLFTLETTGCLGLCGVSPVIMIDDEFYGNLTPEKVEEIIGKYRGKGDK